MNINGPEKLALTGGATQPCFNLQLLTYIDQQYSNCM